MRSGLIAFSCDKCRAASVEDDSGNEVSNYIKESMGCETPTQTPTAWLEKDELWYNCPRKFLIDSVLDFLQEYNSCKDHISTPRPYNEQSAKFLAAVSVYESFCARFIAEKQGDSDVKS